MISHLLLIIVHKVKKFYNKILIIVNMLKTSKTKHKNEKQKRRKAEKSIEGLRIP